MDLFDLYAKISLDDSKYNAGIANATKSGKELSQKFATSYTKGFETFAKTAAKAVTVVGGAVAALGAIGLNYNSQMESYTTNFEVMLGSTEKAAAKVEELKTMAAKTPFGMEDLASATQTLIAFQVPAEQSTDILSMLGDVALGDKNKLAGLATVFGQVSSAGKLQGQDLMQMINQGFNPLNYISQRTGESMEELRDRMSQGAISAEEVTQAFKDATSEGGQFYQGMEKASTTTAGLISTLKDNVKSKLGELFAFASDKLKELLPKVIEFVDKIDVQKIVDKVKLAVEWFEKWSPLILGVVTAFGTLYLAFKAMAIIDAVKNAFAAFNAVMMANPIILIVTLIAGLVVALITLWNTNEDFRNAVIGIWEGIKSAFSSAVDFIVELFTVKIPEAFNNVVAFIASIPAKVLEFALSMYEAGKAFIENLITSISEGFEELYSNIKTWVDEKIIQPIRDAYTKAKDAGKRVIDGVLDGIKQTWDNIVSWVNNAWNSLFGNLKANVSVSASATGTTRAGGLDYVPYNDYPVRAHKGEAILTAAEAEVWRRGNNGGSGTIINQTINAVPQTAAEFADATLAAFQRARWIPA